MFSATARGIPSFGDITWHAPVRLATAAALPANTRSGNTLTPSANGALTVDLIGVSLGDRILVKDEATLPNNGVYVVTAVGSGTSKWGLTRATDADTDDEVQAGATWFVWAGNVNARTWYTQSQLGSTTRIPILNTDNLVFYPLSGSLTGQALPRVTVFTSSGTWTRQGPSRIVIVEVVGGGGGGGGTAATAAGEGACAAGGGAGGYGRIAYSNAGMPATATVTVGGGGAAAAAGNNTGGTGGLSSFAGTGIATVSAGGGSGGGGGANTSGSTTSAGGSAAGASGGDLNVTGDDGGNGRVVSGQPIFGGFGGGNPLAGQTRQNTTGSGAAGGGYGGGGSGASAGVSTAARAGGAGAGGAVIVTEF